MRIDRSLPGWDIVLLVGGVPLAVRDRGTR
jgi:hypothetical protein